MESEARGRGISATGDTGDWPSRFPSPLRGWLLLPGILLRAPSPWNLSLEVTPTSVCSSTCWFPNCRWISPWPHSNRTFCPLPAYKTINSLIRPFGSRSDCTAVFNGSIATNLLQGGILFPLAEWVDFHFPGEVTISKFRGSTAGCLPSSFTGRGFCYYLVYHFIRSFTQQGLLSTAVGQALC